MTYFSIYLSDLMIIEEKPLSHWINNFYGYGSWGARSWIISYEEGGGEIPEEVAEKLAYFYREHPPADRGVLCDIRDLYKHVAVQLDGPKNNLFTNRYAYRFGPNAVQNSVWKNLIAFTNGYNNEILPDMLVYQKESFASVLAQKEALIRLYPLPSPHSHSWYYSWLDQPGLPFLKQRALYQDQVYASRIRTILSNVARHKPALVLMYGMNNINTLKKSVQDLFGGIKFTMNKATKLHIPQHHRANLDGTTLLITTQIPALRHNRIETGFDWHEFGKKARSESAR